MARGRPGRYTQRVVLVVPANRLAAAKAAAAEVDPEGGENAFNIPLRARGGNRDSPITHYWCSWMMTPAQYAVLRNAFRGIAQVREHDGLVKTPQQILTEENLGRRRPPRENEIPEKKPPKGPREREVRGPGPGR